MSTQIRSGEISVASRFHGKAFDKNHVIAYCNITNVSPNYGIEHKTLYRQLIYSTVKPPLTDTFK